MALFVGLCLAFAACGGTSSGTAARGAASLSSSCIPPELRILGGQSSLPNRVSTPLSAAILSRFAVFRRPTLSSDEFFGLSSRGGGLDRGLAGVYDLSRYYPAYVRRLATLPDGRRYFVIPAYGRSEAVPPAHCLVGGARERRALIKRQRRLPTEPVDCIVEVGGADKAPPQGCESFAAVGEGGRVLRADALTKKPIVELAPDGVASVRIVYRRRPAIVVPVSENAFLFTPPSSTPRVEAELRRLLPALLTAHPTASQRRNVLQWDETVLETDPTKLEWLDSAGKAIRVINAPAAGRGAATSAGDLRAPIGG